MDFSRVEAGRLEGHFRPLKLGQVTADLAALFRSTIEKSGIKYAVDCDSTSSQLTYVDPELVCPNLQKRCRFLFKATDNPISGRRSYLTCESASVAKSCRLLTR
jgi:hypothetical protein